MKLDVCNYKQYLLTTYASWLGKIIGIRLGAPVEGWTSEKIEETYHGKLGYLVDYDIFASDDDSNGPLFFVRSLLDKSDITAKDIGDTFLAYIQEYMGFFWWGGVGISTEHTAYENLKQGISAPLSGSKETNGIEIAEQIGGQIFSDCWGYVSGGNANQAKDLAIKASSVTHDENGIQGGIFVAVCIALAYEKNDIFDVLNEALTYLDPTMEYYQKVKIIIEYYYNHPDNWKDCLKFIQDNYGYDKYPGVCHIIPNLCVMIMGMCYGENDFSKTLTIINQSGWDTDCNCGNVGSIMGALVGLENIDESWITPINDIVNSSSCIGYLNIQTVSASSKMFAKIAYKLAGIEIDDADKFDLPFATNGFRSDVMPYVKDNKLVVEGNKVYTYSYYKGEDIYDSRYDPSFSPLVYPGDIIKFNISGNCKVRICVEDCENNFEYSDIFDSNGLFSYMIKTGINKTIRRYGIEKVESNDILYINDYCIEHNPTLKYDFSNYPIDEYGPRYAGDTLYNIRGWAVHSGKWSIDDKGLHFNGEEHGLMSTLAPCLVNEIEAVFSGDLSIVFNMKDYMNFCSIGVRGNDVIFTNRLNGKDLVITIGKKVCNNTEQHFNLCLEDDRILLNLEKQHFEVPCKREVGIVGISNDRPFAACIQSIRIY